MIDSKSTFAEVKCELVESLNEQTNKWLKLEDEQKETPDTRLQASRIRRFLKSVARFAESQG